MSTRKRARAALLLLVTCHLSLVTLSCGARRTPDLERIFESARVREGKRPVIVIPGILGSQLVNQRTGEVVWPSAFRSSEDGLRLPVSPDLAANQDGLAPAKIVETAKLARLAPEVYVYYELLRALENFAGYREGNWINPEPGGDRDTYYVFPYDWRRDNVESARELVRQIEELKRKLNRPDLRFNIVAHSMGGLVARYAAMYGDADLPPEGAPLQPTFAGASSISRVFMIGTPNEGSAEAFATLLEGYSVTEGLRRRVRLLNKLSREDAVTAPSIFQLLPHRDNARFLDQNLQPIAVDLYDPAEWKKYGWAAVNDPEFRRRFERGEAADEEAATNRETLADLDAYFAAALSRARRFHEALDAVTTLDEPTPVPLFAFGGDCEETLTAPVLLRDEQRGAWTTLTQPRPLRRADGTRASRKEVTRAMFAPGDGRVTRRSLLGQDLDGGRHSAFFDTSLPVAYAVFVCDLHSELQKNKVLQNNALTVLVNELLR